MRNLDLLECITTTESTWKEPDTYNNLNLKIPAVYNNLTGRKYNEKANKNNCQSRYSRIQIQKKGDLLGKISYARRILIVSLKNEKRRTFKQTGSRVKVRNLLAELKNTLDAIEADPDFIRFKERYQNATDIKVRAEAEAEASVYGLMKMELMVVSELISIIQEEMTEQSSKARFG